MRDEFIRRAWTNPRLFTQMRELSDRVSEATQHDVTIAVIGYNPPIFTVVVDGSRVDDWMPWDQTIMFLRGLLAGVAFDDTKSYNEGLSAATAQLQRVLTEVKSQDRDSDTAVTTTT